MADEKELTVRIRYINDDAGAKASQKTTEGLSQGTKATGQGAEQANASVKKLNSSMDGLLKVSASLALISGAALRGMTQAIGNYTQNVGSTEAASKQWLLANQDIEMSTVRMGRVLTQIALPYMKQFSGFMEDAAKWTEDPKNAGAIDAGMKILAGGAVLGTVGTVASVGSKLIGGVAGLFKGGAAASAAAGAAGAGEAAAGAGAAAAGAAGAGAAAAGVTAAGVLASVGGGVALGLIANEALANSDLGKKIGVQNLSKWGVALSYIWNRVTGQSETQANQNAAVTGMQNGAIPTNAAPQPSNNDRLGGNLASQIIAYNQYYRQEEQAQRSYLITLARSNRDFQIQQVNEQQDYNLQRSRANRDFSRQEAMSDFEYGRQRTIAARDFGIQLVRSEEDFQKSRKRAAEDFQFQLWDIARSGDAFSYMQATRQYQVQQSREQEDYNISRQRSVEDFQRSQADQDQEYQIQRAFRLESFAIQQTDQEQDFTIRRGRELVQRQIQLDDLKQDYAEQARMRRQAISDALNDMSDGTSKAALYFSTMTSDMITDMQTLVNAGAVLKDYLKDLPAPTAAPGRASGGYVGSGLYRMHDDEFVLNKGTTQALERMAGGSLSQERVLAAIAGGGKSGGASITINDQRRFDSSLSLADRRAIRQDTQYLFDQVLH